MRLARNRGVLEANSACVRKLSNSHASTEARRRPPRHPDAIRYLAGGLGKEPHHENPRRRSSRHRNAAATAADPRKGRHRQDHAGGAVPEPDLLQTEDGSPASSSSPRSACSKISMACVKPSPRSATNRTASELVALDSVDALEPLIWAAVCLSRSWSSIEAPGYGRGYVEADAVARSARRVRLAAPARHDHCPDRP